MNRRPVMLATPGVVLLAALVTGRMAKETSASRGGPASRQALATSPASRDAVKESLYDLVLEHLTDSSGKPILLDVHRGHPVVVSMFYATCPAACPALMTEIKEMDGKLDPVAREKVRYLLVSFDPDRDDTLSLAKVREDHALDARWTLARTDAREVRLLAAALGLRYRFRADGQIDHSTNLALVRPDGGLDIRVDGLGQPKDAMARRIAELSR